MYLIVQVTVFVLFVLFAQNVQSGTSLTSIRRVSSRFFPLFLGGRGLWKLHPNPHYLHTYSSIPILHLRIRLNRHNVLLYTQPSGLNISPMTHMPPMMMSRTKQRIETTVIYNVYRYIKSMHLSFTTQDTTHDNIQD